MKYSAEELSRAGDQYLGRSYAEMDCQEFVERCLADLGCRIDLKGSNAWFRKVREEGWTGSPEECVRTFGSVPAGAFLFIHAFDGGEERRGYHDGLGNASHIGIRTGRGKGAIHSSASRGCVAESEFHDRTVRNGGWNMVGLWNRMDYGTTVNWHLDHGYPEQEPGQKEEKRMTATVTSPNGGPVNLRKAPGKSAALVDRIPAGTEAEVLEQRPEWSRIRSAGKTGWMMNEFLTSGEAEAPGETSGGTWSVTITGLDLTQVKAFQVRYPDCVAEAERG